MKPQYVPRADRGFTPIEAADLIERALADDLRTTPNEREAIRTLIDYARTQP